MVNSKELYIKAKEAMNLSYSPYSHFKVGAALLLKNGEYILGANIENAAYSLCLCAERNAIFQATLKGYKKADFVAIGIIGDSKDVVTPCGSCRQVMAELTSKDMPVYMFSIDGKEQMNTVNELIPFSFSGDSLND